MGIDRGEEPLFSVHSFFNAYLIWLRGVPAGLLPVALMIAAVEAGSPGTLMEIARSRHLQALLPLYILLLGALFILPGYRVSLLKRRYLSSGALFFRERVTVFTGIPGQNRADLPRSLLKNVQVKRGPGQRLAGLCTLLLRGKALTVRVPDIPYDPHLPALIRGWLTEPESYP